MQIEILTLFPEMFAPLRQSILGRAAEKGILNIQLVNIRDYSEDKHRKTDDYPFGGGAGMVMTAQPIFSALRALGVAEKKALADAPENVPENAAACCGKRLLYMSPRGRALDPALVRELSNEEELVILCGHYEGVDQRVLDYWGFEEVSIGDYILTGGELPAMVLVDSVARMLPDVLASEEAALSESVYSGLLEYSQYTKPREYEGMSVPEVLVSGNHKLIRLRNFRQALEITKERRPDLFAAFLSRAEELDKDEKKVLREILENS